MILLLDGQVNKGKAEVHKPVQSLLLYRDMILFYSVRTILDNFPKNRVKKVPDTKVDWTNLGGQIISKADINRILEDIRGGRIKSWDAVHAAYAEAQENYSTVKYNHALHVLQRLGKLESFSLDSRGMHYILNEFQTISEQLIERVLESRRKDYTVPFRKMIYESTQEMEAVLGKMEDNPFLNDYQEIMQSHIRKAKQIKNLIH